MKLRDVLVSATILTTALVLAGCSTNGTAVGGSVTASSKPSAGVSASHNDPDVAFTTNMIAHHQQAIEMADMLLTKQGVEPRVVTLAQDIKNAQGSEITTMTGWLKDWGQPATMAGMPGMAMNGMMSDADMKSLDAASGADAGKLFLTQMTQHHQGAIDMANEEVTTGLSTTAIALAKRIANAQTAEIAKMKELLATL